MKYAIVGDIHSNLEAFTAVLADAKEQGVTHYACVGDVVGYNANPVECMKLVQDLHFSAVRGNHDHYCSHDENLNGFHPLAADAVDWTRQRLSEDMRQFSEKSPAGVDCRILHDCPQHAGHARNVGLRVR